MMDPEGLAIPDVHLIIDSTKAEVMDFFKTVNQTVEQITREQGCRVGVFILSIGFRIYELIDRYKKNHKDLLTSLDAPLSDKNTLHDYQLTCEGEAVPIV